MIISHKHRFIFLHNQKTAGSSVSAALNPYLGPNDLQCGAWQDVIKSGGKFNWHAKKILLRSSPRLLGSTIKQSILQRKLVSSFTLDRLNDQINKEYRNRGLVPPGHTIATNIKKYDEKAWSKYFKFVIVRNPWDHAVSYYYWLLSARKQTSSEVSFNEFLRRMNDWDRPDPQKIRPRRKSGWELYTIDNEIAVDYVVRFENLKDDIRDVSEKIGIPVDIRINAKSNTRDKAKSLKEHYDEECLELVDKIYRPEIACFNYKPPFPI